MSSNPKTLMLPDKKQTHVHRLAMHIADDAARTDIETKCPSFTGDGREPGTTEEIRSAWYDISKVDSEAASLVQLAVSYLTLRGKVIRHPYRNSWIRITDFAA